MTTAVSVTRLLALPVALASMVVLAGCSTTEPEPFPSPSILAGGGSSGESSGTEDSDSDTTNGQNEGERSDAEGAPDTGGVCTFELNIDGLTVTEPGLESTQHANIPYAINGDGALTR
ncbi:MAG TPA: hypothetical protein PK781_07530, partial [Terrimesophilobacter sp.]|nr:hypothetical protein [Terrimesophilobacter sp.]